MTILDGNGNPIDIASTPAFSLEPSGQVKVSDELAFSVYMGSIDPALLGSLSISVQFAQGGVNDGSPISSSLDVVNPCLNVTPVASSLTTQMYKSGAIAKTYTIPAFSINPPQCPLTYSYTSSDSSQTDGLVTFDGATGVFTFDGTASLGEYTLTVTASNPASPSKTASTTFPLKVVAKYCNEAAFTFQSSVFVERTYKFPLDPLKYEWTPPVATGDLDLQCGIL